MTKITAVVRKAKIKDLDQLSDLAMQFFKYHQKLDPYYKLSRDSKPELISLFKSKIYSKNACVLVACQPDDLVYGYIYSSLISRAKYYLPAKIGIIHQIYISSANRGKGISNKLLKTSYSWFRKNKAKDIELFVHVKNKLGLKLWDQQGFKTKLYRKYKRLS